jgi:hypothetical protein
MITPVPRPLLDKSNSPLALRCLRWTLFTLVLVLTFEGVARKINFAHSSVVIFFLKDFIVAVLGLQILWLRRSPAIQWLWTAYVVEVILFLPLIISTAFHDPVLAIFGAKEYLLYPMVGFATFLAFENSTVAEIIAFYRWVALLIIPTTAIALYQLHLPADSWMNMSVEGGSLEGFSANGVLRVSSTFSFVAQYCAFLNAEVFIMAIALSNLRDIGLFRRAVYLFLVPLLILGCYMTGSRGAVLTNLVVIAAACGLSLMKFQARSAIRFVVIIFLLGLTLAATQYAVPDAFQVYSTREDGQLVGASSEIRDRVFDSFFGWTSDVSTTPFLGYGIGIMSNGSETLSDYAAVIRGANWTETDFASTLFEGGIYMVVIWYLFRYFVIFQCVRRFLAVRNDELSVPMSFAVGVVIIVGMIETIGIQPPIAIWWWFAVGSVLLFWWKSEDPSQSTSQSTTPKIGPPTVPKVRGQSSYAARLHGSPENGS